MCVATIPVLQNLVVMSQGLAHQNHAPLVVSQSAMMAAATKCNATTPLRLPVFVFDNLSGFWAAGNMFGKF